MWWLDLEPIYEYVYCYCKIKSLNFVLARRRTYICKCGYCHSHILWEGQCGFEKICMYACVYLFVIFIQIQNMHTYRRMHAPYQYICIYIYIHTHIYTYTLLVLTYACVYVSTPVLWTYLLSILNMYMYIYVYVYHIYHELTYYLY